MEASVFLLKGIILGFSIAAPVGPIGVLCIRRTLAGGIPAGVISGLGTALADSLYGLIAAFGITAISSLLLEQSFVLRLCGGLALLYMGRTTYLSHPADTAASSTQTGQAGNFGSAFLLTLTNPLTILSFTAMFAGLGVGDAHNNYGLAAVMVGGVFYRLPALVGCPLLRRRLFSPMFQTALVDHRQPNLRYHYQRVRTAQSGIPLALNFFRLHTRIGVKSTVDRHHNASDKAGGFLICQPQQRSQTNLPAPRNVSSAYRQ